MCAQVLNVVEHQWDNPVAIPKRQLGKLLYGADSVFARSPRPDQVRALTREDIAAHLARWQRPDNAVLGVAGTARRYDFDCRITTSSQLLHDRPAALQLCVS